FPDGTRSRHQVRLLQVRHQVLRPQEARPYLPQVRVGPARRAGGQTGPDRAPGAGGGQGGGGGGRNAGHRGGGRGRRKGRSRRSGRRITFTSTAKPRRSRRFLLCSCPGPPPKWPRAELNQKNFAVFAASRWT